jgi:predicted Rossmann fold flavoprotein
MFDVVIIGGGAAGFYGGIQIAERNKSLSILILEKTTKLLSKVRVSGGGRCNVTHHCFEVKKLATHYPRGEKTLRQIFRSHQASDVVDWFEKQGVKLKTEEDGRMFPTTDDSQSIIGAFLQAADRYNIEIRTSKAVNNIASKKNGFTVSCEDGTTLECKKVFVTIGGHANPLAYAFLKDIGHTIKNPIPSLFTFNDSKKHFKDLMGIAVPNTWVKIEGTKFTEKGALLITHWGLSGPCVIKLSAWAAEYLHKQQYNFTALVSWIGEWKEDELREKLVDYKSNSGKQKVYTNPLFELPLRLWQRLCELAEIPAAKIWSELPLKNLNKLIENLLRCRFDIKGKTTFKEEFVTCGGVPLAEVDIATMQSTLVPNLYFAGEVLDIDGETGGFNFQSAWTTAYIAAESIGKV